ncbi:MAG TPA: GNAT family N-acetyltransferase [Ktedonobacterales bacterium]|jgi:predicted acetyltransferase
MKSERLELVLPSLELEAAYQQCEADFQRAGETFLGAAGMDYPRFVARCQNYDQVDEGKVPQLDFFLLRDGATILGWSGLRLWLTPNLEDIGGHIGYRIRPTERRKGYGTHILAMTLAEARQCGLRDVLLTCDGDNIGSRRIIERNGGQLASESVSPQSGVCVARYWIHIHIDGDEQRGSTT